MAIAIDLGQAIHALSDALDLASAERALHGKRVGFMALRCGEALGLARTELEDLFYAGLLHDFALDASGHPQGIDPLEEEDAEPHCVHGGALLAAFPPLAHLSPVLRHHHTPWATLRDLDAPAASARLANLICLMDQVDALTLPDDGRDLLLVRHDIRDRIRLRRDPWFEPALVASFLEVSASEAFWLSLEARHLLRFIRERVWENRLVSLSFAELRRLALIFVQVVAIKSPYTLAHSLGTARLARFLAEVQGLPPDTRDRIEIAALLHDLGKLRVPDEVLQKPGPLTPAEQAAIQRHSFETYQLLRGIAGLEDVALWAAYHHEKPNGLGYPFQRHGAELSIETRIIAVADVFQALSQDRPYRQPLSSAQILNLLQESARDHHLDRAVVARVERRLDDCWRLARGGDPAESPAGLVPAP